MTASSCVVVVVEVVEGVCCPPLPQAAKVLITISTEALAMAIRRRLVRPVITIHVPFVIEVLIATVDAGRLGRRGRRQNLGREQVAAGWVDALLRRRRRRCARWRRRRVVVVVVVVVVEGACSPLLPHPAVNAPIAIRAPPPATTIKRRVNEFELMKIRSSRRTVDRGRDLLGAGHCQHSPSAACSFFGMLNPQYAGPL